MKENKLMKNIMYWLVFVLIATIVMAFSYNINVDLDEKDQTYIEGEADNIGVSEEARIQEIAEKEITRQRMDKVNSEFQSAVWLCTLEGESCMEDVTVYINNLLK